MCSFFEKKICFYYYSLQNKAYSMKGTEHKSLYQLFMLFVKECKTVIFGIYNQ